MENKELNLFFYSDDGHGWLELSLKQLSLCDATTIDKISTCSYVSKMQKYYLEEDCDAPLVMKDLESKGYKLNIGHRRVDGRSTIRNLPRFGVIS